MSEEETLPAVPVPAPGRGISTPADFYGRMDSTLEAANSMGTILAKSGMFGCKTPEQGAVMVLTAMMEGCSPLEIAKRYHIIEGSLSMRSDAMQAGFQKAGGRIKWIKTTTEVCEAMFFHQVHAPEGQLVTLSFDELVQSGVALTKTGTVKGTYKRHPRQMLRSRVISEGVRMILPEVIMGIYTPEEIQDFEEPYVPDPELSKMVVEENPTPPAAKTLDAEPVPETEKNPEPKKGGRRTKAQIAADKSEAQAKMLTQKKAEEKANPTPEDPPSEPVSEEPVDLSAAWADPVTIEYVLERLSKWMEVSNYDMDEVKSAFTDSVMGSTKVKDANEKQMKQILTNIDQAEAKGAAQVSS